MLCERVRRSLNGRISQCVLPPAHADSCAFVSLAVPASDLPNIACAVMFDRVREQLARRERHDAEVRAQRRATERLAAFNDLLNEFVRPDDEPIDLAAWEINTLISLLRDPSWLWGLLTVSKNIGRAASPLFGGQNPYERPAGFDRSHVEVRWRGEVIPRLDAVNVDGAIDTGPLAAVNCRSVLVPVVEEQREPRVVQIGDMLFSDPDLPVL